MMAHALLAVAVVGLTFVALTVLAYGTIAAVAFTVYGVQTLLDGGLGPTTELLLAAVVYLAGVALTAMMLRWLVRRLHRHGLSWAALVGAAAFSAIFTLALVVIVSGTSSYEVAETIGFAVILQPHALLMGPVVLMLRRAEVRGQGSHDRGVSCGLLNQAGSVSLTPSSSDPER